MSVIEPSGRLAEMHKLAYRKYLPIIFTAALNIL